MNENINSSNLKILLYSQCPPEIKNSVSLVLLFSPVRSGTEKVSARGGKDPDDDRYTTAGWNPAAVMGGIGPQLPAGSRLVGEDHSFQN